jgi:hypothetical protein
MVKALLVAHAESLEGGTDKMPIPNEDINHPPTLNQGFGRVHLDSLFQTGGGGGGGQETVVDELFFDEDHTPGGYRRFTESPAWWNTPQLTVDDATRDLVVALAYTDRYGDPVSLSTNKIVNDLDLALYHEDEMYYGNHFGTDGYSQREPQVGWVSYADRYNTVELIRVPGGDIAEGSFTVSVAARALRGKAVPGLDGGAEDFNQDFALYVYNASD